MDDVKERWSLCYLVVEATLVFITVSVYRAEQSAAPAGEPGQPHLLLAGGAPVLLLLPVLVPGPLITHCCLCSTTRSTRLLHSLSHRGQDGDSGLGCLHLAGGGGGGAGGLSAEAGHPGAGAAGGWHRAWPGHRGVLLDELFVADWAEAVTACIGVEATTILAEGGDVLLDVAVSGVHSGCGW